MPERTPGLKSHKRRRSKSVVLAVLISVSLLLLTACVGDLDPDGGWAAPVIDGEYVYLGAKDGRITRLDLSADGRFDPNWGYPVSGNDKLGPLYGTPRIQDGQVISASYDCSGLDCEAIVVGISADSGNELWRFVRQTQIVGSVAISGETVLFGTSSIQDEFDTDPGFRGADGYLYAVKTTSDLGPTVLWRVPTTDSVWGTPVIDNDVVYFGDLDGVLHAVSLGGEGETAGTELWTFEAGGAIVAEPLVVDGKIYFGDFNDTFYALDITRRNAAGPGTHALGPSEWSFESDGWFWATPLLVDDILYVGTLNGKFYALDSSTGQQRWAIPAEVDGQIVGRAAIFQEIGKGMALAVPSGKDNIGAFLASNGAELNPFATNGGVKSDLLVDDGVLYVHTTDDDLIRFRISDHSRLSCIKAETGGGC